MSSVKPMSSISSASSRITVWIASSASDPRPMWSSARPGVATTTWAPRSRAWSCRPIGWPPNTGTTLTPSLLPYLNMASLTWTASSRVGTSTSTCGTRRDRVDHLQRRQCERSGLAGAGRGLAEEVLAGEEQRDGLALDRGRLFVAEVVERSEQFVAQPEVGEPVRRRSRVRARRLSACQRPVGRPQGADRNWCRGRGSSRAPSGELTNDTNTIARIEQNVPWPTSPTGSSTTPTPTSWSRRTGCATTPIPTSATASSAPGYANELAQTGDGGHDGDQDRIDEVFARLAERHRTDEFLSNEDVEVMNRKNFAATGLVPRRGPAPRARLHRRAEPAAVQHLPQQPALPVGAPARPRPRVRHRPCPQPRDGRVLLGRSSPAAHLLRAARRLRSGRRDGRRGDRDGRRSAARRVGLPDGSLAVAHRTRPGVAPGRGGRHPGRVPRRRHRRPDRSRTTSTTACRSRPTSTAARRTSARSTTWRSRSPRCRRSRR